MSSCLPVFLADGSGVMPGRSVEACMSQEGSRRAGDSWVQVFSFCPSSRVVCELWALASAALWLPPPFWVLQTVAAERAPGSSLVPEERCVDRPEPNLHPETN